MNFDIFNLKKVEELERELHEVKRERDAYAEDLKILRKKFEAFEEARLKMPYDCKKGPWCDACAYKGHIHYGNEFYNDVVYCKKGVNGCPNIILIDGYSMKEETNE